MLSVCLSSDSGCTVLLGLHLGYAVGSFMAALGGMLSVRLPLSTSQPFRRFVWLSHVELSAAVHASSMAIPLPQRLSALAIQRIGQRNPFQNIQRFPPYGLGKTQLFQRRANRVHRMGRRALDGV